MQSSWRRLAPACNRSMRRPVSPARQRQRITRLCGCYYRGDREGDSDDPCSDFVACGRSDLAFLERPACGGARGPMVRSDRQRRGKYLLGLPVLLDRAMPGGRAGGQSRMVQSKPLRDADDTGEAPSEAPYSAVLKIRALVSTR